MYYNILEAFKIKGTTVSGQQTSTLLYLKYETKSLRATPELSAAKIQLEQ